MKGLIKGSEGVNNSSLAENEKKMLCFNLRLAESSTTSPFTIQNRSRSKRIISYGKFEFAIIQITYRNYCCLGLSKQHMNNITLKLSNYSL